MEPRFHFFPEPFTDETLHSVLSRYARLSGFRCGVKDAALPIWKWSFSDNVPFPCQLGELESALPPGTDLTTAHMIERHTLLPYFRPFLSELQNSQACDQMHFGQSSNLKLKMGLIASRLEHALCARFCLECIEQDQADVGASYWHRVHQLPGVYLCPLHDTPLMVLRHPSFSQFRRRLMLPEDDAVISQAHSLEVTDIQLPKLREIATSSQTLLQANAPPLDAFRVRSLLLKGAIAAGVASDAGRLCLGKLVGFMDDHANLLPRSGEYRILGLHPKGAPPTWVTKLLRKPRHTHHPLKYIVLANALHLDASQLLNDEDSSQTGMISPPSSNFVSLPARSSLVSTQSSESGHPRTTKLSYLGQLIWKDAEKGKNAFDIASKQNVSLATVYRAIRMSPDGPERWKDSRFKRELVHRRGRFVRQYHKRFAHECSDYFWLYRNDRDWLTERCNLRSDHRPDVKPGSIFAKLDPILASEIHTCADKLFSLPGKPVWVNRSRIGRELGSQARFEKQLKQLPKCAAVLDDICETRQQFYCRRLAWAEEQLLQNGMRITRSSLYKTASIRIIDRS